MKLPDYYRQSGCCLICEDRICNEKGFVEKGLRCFDCRCKDCNWRIWIKELGKGVCVRSKETFSDVLIQSGLIPTWN